MKKSISFLVAIFTVLTIAASVPQKISYQAVVRNSSNNLVVSSGIGMQVSILEGSVNGTAVYIERHFPTTNANGLVTIQIGAGTVVNGTFSTIDWSLGTYFIKIEYDLNGGANYSISGTNQLLSVPYAIYAETAGNGVTAALTSQITSLATQQTTSNANMLTLQSQISSINADITNITNSIVSLQVSSTATNAQLTSLQANVTALQNIVNALQVTVITLQTNVASLTANQATTNTRLAAIELYISNHP